MRSTKSQTFEDSKGCRREEQISGRGSRPVARVAVTTLVLLTRTAGTRRVARRLLTDDLAGVDDRSGVDARWTGLSVPVSPGAHDAGFAINGWCGVLQLLWSLRAKAGRHDMRMVLR
jgi:hypothetical protein